MAPRPIAKKKIKFENDDYQKLFDFLVERFDANDKKNEKQEGRLDKLEKVVGKIEITMDFMNERMATKQELAVLRDEMLGHIDGLAKKIDDYQIEQGAMAGQLIRHEKWHFKLAKRVGVDLLAE